MRFDPAGTLPDIPASRPRAVQVQCPAKVNLFLEVTGRRPDGYHRLATLFAKIALFDVLDAEEGGSGVELEIVDETGQGLSSGKDNLVRRAAEAFRRRFRGPSGVRLRLTKRIPMGAGLGGGSSDAAGTLLALARLRQPKVDRSLLAKLKPLAAELGADVPFFLRPEPLCDGRGIGERLRGVPAGASLPWMLVVHPGVATATKDVYGRLRLPPRPAVLTALSQLDTLKRNIEKGRPISEWAGLLFNRLEEAVLETQAEVRQAKRILAQAGLQGVMMSGSGSSVFGFVPSREEGEKIHGRLQGYPWKVFLTCCLG